MNLNRLLAAIAAGTLMLPVAAFAGTESGFYVGAGIGQASVGDIEIEDEGEIDFDGDDTAFKVFGGYNFGWIPFLDLAIEGGYVDFGKPDDTVNNVNVEADANGFDLFGLVGVTLGPVGLFGKVGMISWDGDVSAQGESIGDDGTDPAYGIGARLKFGSIEVRAEYEYFDIDASDVDMISASGVWTF